MDDDTFKTELLSRLDRIQAQLSYLCGAAKAFQESSSADAETRQRADSEQQNVQPPPARSLLQDEMNDGYNQAIQRWKSGKV
jgi:hypothetical protein